MSITVHGARIEMPLGADPFGVCDKLHPGERRTVKMSLDEAFFVESVGLYDHENGRVDVSLSCGPVTLRWSSLFHQEDVKLGVRCSKGQNELSFTMTNVSDEVVLLRMRVRGYFV